MSSSKKRSIENGDLALDNESGDEFMPALKKPKIVENNQHEIVETNATTTDSSSTQSTENQTFKVTITDFSSNNSSGVENSQSTNEIKSSAAEPPHAVDTCSISSDHQPHIDSSPSGSLELSSSADRLIADQNQPNLPQSSRFASFTDPGTRYGTLNQDSHFVETITTSDDTITVIGVFDGHGKHGETASKLACQFFRNRLIEHLSRPKYCSMREHEKFIRNTFEGAHHRIIAEYQELTTLNFDGYTFSLGMTEDRVDFYTSPKCPYVLLQDFGTTAVVTIYWEKTRQLIVANCGDSDALIGRWDSQKQSIEPNLLTISDNVSCNENGEHDRIRRDYGRKTKFGGGYLSPNDPTYGFHSLAMTRALGHKFLEKYGVTWDPHIRRFEITPEDLVLVVASDGLFDVVNNEAILSIAAGRIASAGGRVLDPKESSEKLVQLALENWKKQFGTSNVADNTTVVVFKISSAFDDAVPIRGELTNSGTSFSPETTAMHALEDEIEETGIQNLCKNGNNGELCDKLNCSEKCDKKKELMMEQNSLEQNNLEQNNLEQNANKTEEQQQQPATPLQDQTTTPQTTQELESDNEIGTPV